MTMLRSTSAQDSGVIEYAEKRTDPVATYTAVDPEGVAIAWSLSGADAADFTIAGGVLAFVRSPDFENPTDRVGTDPSTAVAGDNIYEVVVEATDGTGHVGREAVAVEVTNVDEAGTVKLSALQPAPTVAFTAALTDIDNPADDLTGSAEWQWSRSQSASGGWDDIDKATKSAYTPDVNGGDEGYYLRATAKYRDRQSPGGADNDKTASMVSANKVLALRTTNDVPEFAAVQDPDGTDDNDKAIAKRDVTETATAGQLVGDPVTAEDEDAADVLTYTLDDDSDNFVIDRATGQISVAKGAKFNVDENIPGVAAVGSYTVMVIATDPKGIPTADADPNANDDMFRDTVEVTITVTAVDEPPIFTVTAAVSFGEDDAIDEVLATFVANDPETNDAPTLGIRGADSSKFTFDATSGALMFKAAPDFEKPADADKNNVYEVTITAADVNANMSTRDIKVTVTNAEEPGEVKLSQSRPRVGVAITASYSDDDGGLASAEWQWWRSVAVNDSDTATLLPDLADPAGNGDWAMIEGANSATYTPVEDDDAAMTDVGKDLLAVVSYTDAKRNADDADRDRAGLVSDNPVAVDTRNRAPVFGDQDSDTPGTQNQTAMREVAENTKGDVGSAVIAEDPDPNEDPLIYALSGADAALFSVVGDGQITVKSGTKLDYEAAKNVYMVTLTATDSFSDSASIDVTITVTDADEEPDVTGDAEKEYAEKGTDPVATYTAVDPEGVAIAWSLSGADAADFTIAGGVLAFVRSPDFENPTDRMGTDPSTAVAGDNIYEVVVEATDGTGHVGREAVAVEVTNVNEAGTVKLSALQPAPTVAFTAALTDIDNPADDLTGSAEWQWSRSRSASRGWADIDKATKSAYTPEVNGGDSGYYLRATAKYRDRQSPGGADNDKTASMVSANKVLALRTTNDVPEFAAVQDPDGTDDNDKAIAKRDVTETATAGQLVGDPVTAEDEDAADVLTYTLDDDSDNFVIDRATGQISVAKGAKFNVDENIPGVAAVGSYTVMVIATDPKGIPTADADPNANDDMFRDTVEVTITVTAVDEPPIFTVTAAVSFGEDDAIDEVLATFVANDPETNDAPTLGIRGADSSKFTFDATSGALMFKAAPDFEKPADADKNNVYEVTITAADVNANMSTRDIKVTVTNAEEPGEVKLSQSRPRVGVAITASYSDDDGGLASAEWQWWRSVAVNDSDTATLLPDLADPAGNGDWAMIEGANSATYTPVEDDDAAMTDVGKDLLAVVSYTDAKRNADDADRDRAGLVSDNPVAVDTRNRAPVFGDQDSDTPGTQNQTAMREVAENTKGDVGSAVIAEDPDPNEDPLIYALSGADAALFSVVGDGQITVKSGTKLDYEAAKNVYMVTLTATDSFSDSASIDVTITVTDVDEEPKISVGGLAVTGVARMDYAENGEGDVATYTASGPDSDSAMWSLEGADAGDFDISSSGVLTFKSSPDHETPADADTDNAYEVTVTASDSGGLSDSSDVTITVTDVNEAPVAPTVANQKATKDTAFSYTVPAFADPEGGTITYTATLSDGSALPGWLSFNASTRELSGTPLEADTPASLTIEVGATDDGSPSASAQVTLTLTVGEEAPTTLLDRYDTDKDGWIQLKEARVAVGDYFGPPQGVELSLDDTRKVVGLYFEYKNRQ